MKFPQSEMTECSKEAQKGLAQVPHKTEIKRPVLGLFACKCGRFKSSVFALRENIQQTTTCGAAESCTDCAKLTLKYWLDQVNNVFALVSPDFHAAMWERPPSVWLRTHHEHVLARQYVCLLQKYNYANKRCAPWRLLIGWLTYILFNLFSCFLFIVFQLHQKWKLVKLHRCPIRYQRCWCHCASNAINSLHAP